MFKETYLKQQRRRTSRRHNSNSVQGDMLLTSEKDTSQLEVPKHLVTAQMRKYIPKTLGNDIEAQQPPMNKRKNLTQIAKEFI